jgi:hypothetical protein
MRCAHCGLQTDGETSHGTIDECVEALLAETRRLRAELAALQRTSDVNAPASRAPQKPQRRR